MNSTALKWVLWAVAITVLLATIVSALVSFVLPGYVENKLIPGLADDFRLTPDQAHIRRIGWWGADLGPIRLSANNTPAITIATIQVDYSPLSLLQGQITGITIGGLGIEISVTPKGVTLAGRQYPTHPASPNSGGSELDLKTLLPIKLDRISVLQSHLTVILKNRRHDIPFEIEMDTHRLSAGYLDGNAELAAGGNSITLSVSIDQSANNGRITFDIHDALLESFSQFVRMPAELSASGAADLSGWGTFELQPLKLSGLSISGQFRDTYLAASKVSLQNLTSTPDDPLPITLSIKGDGLEKLQWHCEPFRLSSLMNIDINRFRGDLAYTNGNWSLNSVIKTVVPKQKMQDRVKLESDVAMGWQMTAQGDRSDDIEFDLISQTEEPLEASMKGNKINSKKQEISINGHFRNSTLSAKGHIIAKEVLFQLPDGKMTAPLLEVDGSVTLPAEDVAAPSLLTAQATLPDIHSKWETTSMHLPKMTLQTTGERKPSQPWSFDARLDLFNGRITDQSKRLRISKLSMALPLRWPDTTTAANGAIKIKNVQWNNHDMGGIKGVLKQSQKGVTLQFHHISKLFPGMRVLFNGRIDNSGARLDAIVPPHNLADDIDLGRFAPEAAGFYATGQIGASGRMTADESGIKASGRFKFNQGRLHEDAQGFFLDGIDMEIQMDDLLEIKSAPQQRLRIGHMTMGKLTADHLDVEFQIEDPKTLFIEKAGINWSQGKINTASIRIIAEKEDYDVTLFCDRLNLAMVLAQLGAAEGGGEGTVSGRIPVRWTKRRLSFDNGFLYSAPGQSGSIQLTGTQMLLSGLPPGSPQHTQLDIATEALKDYIYKWAKLNLLSEGETLLLKLQFDGKPNRLLPFAYDQSLGQFKRVAGEGQADFKGISIDLNFRSPLNDIINYKDLLKQEN